MLQSRRNETVECAVERGIGHRADELGHHRRYVMERLELLLALVQRTGPARHHGDERVPVPVLRNERERRGDLEGGETTHLFGRVLDVLAIKAKDVADVLQFVEHRAAVDVLDRV